MKYRLLGRTGWQISEVGYGMWGMASWSGSDEKETEASLALAIEMGVNFFDTAWAYSEGKSERILGELLKRNANKKLYAASKIPPLNLQWPAKAHYKIEDCFPPSHIIEYTEKTLANLKVDTIDLMQFHVWTDNWVNDEGWKRAIEKLTKEGKVRAWGLSVNRWEPENCLETIKTGLIDSIQVVYNIFDQSPEDKLFPLCDELNIGIIARVPFDEGTLTGTLTKDTKFPPGDFRSIYFKPENLIPSVERADTLKTILPNGMTLPELALRFILNNKTVSTTIPGMRKLSHVKANAGVSDGKGFPSDLLKELRNHRWDRVPAPKDI